MLAGGFKASFNDRCEKPDHRSSQAEDSSGIDPCQKHALLQSTFSSPSRANDGCRTLKNLTGASLETWRLLSCSYRTMRSSEGLHAGAGPNWTPCRLTLVTCAGRRDTDSGAGPMGLRSRGSHLSRHLLRQESYRLPAPQHTEPPFPANAHRGNEAAGFLVAELR